MATKNNKKQVDRPKKGVMRQRASLVLLDDGMIDPNEFCIASLVDHLYNLMVKLLGVDVYGASRRG